MELLLEGLIKALKDYGAWGVILLALIHILVNSEIVIHYRGHNKKPKLDQ
jgi:hypothetical protein